MTVSSVNLTNLRNAKNAVIGNPSAKLQLARDPSFVSNLVDCLNFHDARADIRIEAAHIVASLTYGSDEALLALLRANAPHALLFAIAHFSKDDSPSLRAAFSRALRAITVSAADAIGPSQWGLGPASSIAEHDARDTLEFLFHPDSLDTLLPLLVDTTSQVPVSIAQLLASAVRLRHYCTTISEWLPPAERTKAKETPRRGWEKATLGPGPARLGGWAARQLVTLAGSKDIKLQEAALGALAALAKDSSDVAAALARPSTDRESPLTTILGLTKSRSLDVQLSASLCAAHIIRGLPRHQQDESFTRLVMNTVNRMIASPLGPDTSSEPGFTGGQVTLSQRTKACFVLYHLVSDDAALCQAAFDRGCLAQLIGLVTALPLPPTPPSFIAEAEMGLTAVQDGKAGAAGAGKTKVYIPPTEDEVQVEGADEEWCESEERAALREATLTTIAAISLFDNDIRRSLTEPSMHASYHHPSSSFPSPYSPYSHLHAPIPADLYNSPPSTSSSSRTPSPPPLSSTDTSPPLLPVLLLGLAHPAPGVRYAACQCIRAMSRAVAVLRTNIVDSGLGVGVWRRCVKGKGKSPKGEGATPTQEARGSGTPGGLGSAKNEEGEGEKDKRVLGAGLAVICNLVNDFSPLRPALLEDGLVERLVEILEFPESSLRVSALWAIKNLLYRSSTEMKIRVMKEVGWTRLLALLNDPEVGMREQALNVLRNITENEAGVELVHKEVGEDVLLEHVAAALKSVNDDVVLQAAYLLANLANDPEAPHQARILAHPKVLPALHAALLTATITPTSPSSGSGSTSTSASTSFATPTSPTVTSPHSHTPHSLTQAPRAQARGPLVSCVAQLAKAGAAQVRAAGFEGALRHVCEWAGGGLGGGRGAAGGWDDDRQVAEKARHALRLLEHA
ncbi:hypothetical protein H0H87_009702 [Tephrocybe sp. NHM501043]|nr:hypothetical protein H0H87_009702 [Tephrocybe sp. NHM501043]